MPEARGKQLSAESLDALIFALGLSEPDTSRGSAESVTPTAVVSNPSRLRKSASRPFSRPNGHEVEGSSNMDSAEMFGRNYLSDFGIHSTFDECHTSDGEWDRIPSRPDSFLETFEMVDRYMADTPIPQSPPVSPMSPSYEAADSIYLKVAHNAAIIMLRVPRNISFMDLKRRLYDKFVNQQRIFLSHTFSVLLALPPDSLPKSPPSSPDYKRVSFASRTEMRFIRRDSDWRNIVSSSDGYNKITLRILDSPP
ncbi:hypothetical protein BDN70DRAFT_872714 [Pholiota conissans]|uniref:Uncharacterized protein n=1 Tax=Pholiota conissans TaxID=109636 RepID=A0A9P5ZAD5_9AGAR|nr:hypothetical protein BDN70DRAFT_872714 [Pholiota conissans]